MDAPAGKVDLKISGNPLEENQRVRGQNQRLFAGSDRPARNSVTASRDTEVVGAGVRGPSAFAIAHEHNTKAGGLDHAAERFGG